MSEAASYLGLAQFIQAQGGVERANADLAQLFRGLAFNVAVDDRDGIAGGNIDQRRAPSQPMQNFVRLPAGARACPRQSLTSPLPSLWISAVAAMRPHGLNRTLEKQFIAKSGYLTTPATHPPSGKRNAPVRIPKPGQRRFPRPESTGRDSARSAGAQPASPTVEHRDGIGLVGRYSTGVSTEPRSKLGTNSTYRAFRPTITTSIGRLSRRFADKRLHSDLSRPEG